MLTNDINRVNQAPVGTRLTESVTLHLLSEREREKLKIALKRPQDYAVGLVAVPRGFNAPCSLIFDGRGLVDLYMGVLDARTDPTYDRFEILNKLTTEAQNVLGVEDYPELRDKIYSKESPHNLPLLAACRFRQLGEIEVLDLWSGVQWSSERQLIAAVPATIFYFLLRSAFGKSYSARISQAVKSRGAFSNLKDQLDFNIAEPLISGSGKLDTIHPLKDKMVVVTRNTFKPLRTILTGVYRYSLAVSYPVLFTDRSVFINDGGIHRWYRRCQFCEVGSPNAPEPITVRVLFDFRGVHEIRILQNGQAVEHLKFENPLNRPVKFLWDPLSELYYQLGIWTGRQLRGIPQDGSKIKTVR